MQPHLRPTPSRSRSPLPQSGNTSQRATACEALEFGRFRILLRRRQLLADDVPVKLGTRAFNLLLVLLEANGSLVTKEELMSRVWPGTVVSEENIKFQISVLRKALGADRDVIHTEFGRGYRFTGLLGSDAAGDPGRRSMRSAARSGRTLFSQSCRQSISDGLICSIAQSCGNVMKQAHSSVIKAAAFATGLGIGLVCCPVFAAPASGGETVQGLYDALLNTRTRALGQSGRFTQLAPVIHRSFDIASMARLSVGPSWSSLTDAQRQQMTESYGRDISAIYADRFDGYAGQKFEVMSEQPAPVGVMVKSQITKANGEPVKVDYLMRRSSDSWLISDIYVDGAISEIAMRRSEFAAIVRSEGIQGLITTLNRKADHLTGTTASALEKSSVRPNAAIADDFLISTL
jgi:hopanoid biosynthesis associated membrane protein HpnM